MSAIDTLKAGLTSWAKMPMKLGGDGAARALVSLADILANSVVTYKYGDEDPTEDGAPGQFYIKNDGSGCWVWANGVWAPIAATVEGSAPTGVPQDVLDLIAEAKKLAEDAGKAAAAMGSPTKLAPAQKLIILSGYRTVKNEQDEMITLAKTYALSTDKYEKAVSDLDAAMRSIGLAPGVNEDIWIWQTTETDVNKLVKLIGAVGDERRKITMYAAQQASVVMQGMSANADTANIIEMMGDDNVLSTSEKYSVLVNFKGYYTAKADNVQKALDLGVDSAPYVEKIDNLIGFMEDLGLPLTERTNMLRQSNNFAIAPWSKSAGLTLTAGALDPQGGFTAWHLTSVGPSTTPEEGEIVADPPKQFLKQTVTVEPGEPHTFSFYVKAIAPPVPPVEDMETVPFVRAPQFSIFDVQNNRYLQGPEVYITDYDKWVRVDYPFTPAMADDVGSLDCTSVTVALLDDVTTETDMYVWGAQVEWGNVATPYLATGAVPTTVTDTERDAPFWLSRESQIDGQAFRKVFEEAAAATGELLTALAKKAYDVADIAQQAIDAARGAYDSLQLRLAADRAYAEAVNELALTKYAAADAAAILPTKANVNLQNAEFGSVGANLIAGRAVTAGKLTVTNLDNLFPNGNCEYIPTGTTWASGVPTFPSGFSGSEFDSIYDPGAGNAYAGTKVRRIVSSAGTRYKQVNHEIPCVPGEQFYFETFAKFTVKGNVSSTAYAYVRFLDSSGVEITTPAPDTWSSMDSEFGTKTLAQSGSWTKINCTSGPAPSNAVSVRFAIGLDSSATMTVGETAYYDSLFAHKMADGKLVVDGSITASKLVITGQASSLTFDPQTSEPTAWATGNGNGTWTIQTITDGEAGNTAIRSLGTGRTDVLCKTAVPFDIKKTYRIKAKVRKSATANGGLYLVVALFDSNGANIAGGGGDGGDYWYYPVVNDTTVPTTWKEFMGTFGAKGTKAFAASGRTMKVGVILNNGGTAGYMEAQDVRIEEVLPGTLIENGAIVTAKLDAEAVTSDKLQSKSVTSKHITITNWDNLFPNGTSEIPKPTNWVDPGGIIANSEFVNNGIKTDPEFQFIYAATATDASGYNAGNFVRKLVGTGGESQLGVYLPVIPGEQFYFECMARKTAGVGNAGVYYSVTRADGVSVASGGALAGSTWGKISLSVNVPVVGAGGVTEANRPVKVYVYVYSDTGITTEFDALYLQKKNDANLIVDGTITAGKLSLTDMEGNVVGWINGYVGGVKISGDKIDITGNVTFTTTQTKAVDAYNKADNAEGKLADIANDGKLTPSEKAQVLLDYRGMWVNKGTIDTQAGSYTPVVSAVAYDNALNALKTFMEGLGLTLGTNDDAWVADPAALDIDGPLLRSTFATAYSEEAKILMAISEAAAAKAKGDLTYALNGGRDRTTTEIDGAKITTGTVNAQRLGLGVTKLDRISVSGSNSDNASQVHGVSINGGALDTTGVVRGHNFIVYDKTTHALVMRNHFDTYGSDAERTAAANFINAWSASDVIICIFSYDAIGTNAALVTALKSIGASSACEVPVASRVAYAFIGWPNLGEGNGLEMRSGAISSSAVTATWADSDINGKGGTNDAYTIIEGGRIRTNTIDATKIVTQGLELSSYTEDGSGNPTAGAKVYNAAAGQPPIKVAPAGFQIGQKKWQEQWFAGTLGYYGTLLHDSGNANLQWGNRIGVGCVGNPTIESVTLYNSPWASAKCIKIALAQPANLGFWGSINTISFNFSHFHSSNVNWNGMGSYTRNIQFIPTGLPSSSSPYLYLMVQDWAGNLIDPQNYSYGFTFQLLISDSNFDGKF
jgi:hypothetical protein